MSELSTKARAFSVEALLGERGATTQNINNIDIPNTTSIDKRDQNNCTIVADLCCRDLWQRFHELGTEMIVTKAGRRMFPTMKVRLSGLNPNTSYIVFLDIIPLDNKRYRYIYHSSQWTVAREGDPPLAPCVYIHPDSPASGQLWMAQGVIAFDKLKLTNNKNPKVRGQISLHSMQKYVPRIHVLPIVELSLPVPNENLITNALTFSFKETQFITVTAYQNQKITQLKIASNPFAKGFRVAVRNRQLNLNLPQKLSTQEIFTTFSDNNCASAFQKFQPNLQKSESNSEDTQAVPHPMETPLVYPLFSNGYKQSSYNIKEISIFKKIF